MVGLLDLPAPLFGWIDGLMSSLPTLLRLALWGALGGTVSMWLYRRVSPQQRIARGREQQLALRRRLDAFDGELTDAWPLIRQLLGSSLRQVGRVTLPAVVASLPVLCLLVWLSTAYGYRFPDDADAPAVRASPAPLSARWVDEPGHGGRVLVVDPRDRRSAEVALEVPVPVVERWHWWNLLIANPAGYLAGSHPVQRVVIDLPRRSYLGSGPSWVRGWEFPFFVSLFAVSLALKRLLHIH